MDTNVIYSICRSKYINICVYMSVYEIIWAHTSAHSQVNISKLTSAQTWPHIHTHTLTHLTAVYKYKNNNMCLQILQILCYTVKAVEAVEAVSGKCHDSQWMSWNWICQQIQFTTASCLPLLFVLLLLLCFLCIVSRTRFSAEMSLTQNINFIRAPICPRALIIREEV